ncbi:hypothetical protein SAY87_005209 [Trapa incisa]|uniref:Uncharacterized protein n=1 Tax=Trapa incisa TaxID=236973 RepID=A0AAN7K5G3_9MYRT|nr:hypothetical protein SAY87_005209 [Trapa incisa]
MSCFQSRGSSIGFTMKIKKGLGGRNYDMGGIMAEKSALFLAHLRYELLLNLNGDGVVVGRLEEIDGRPSRAAFVFHRACAAVLELNSHLPRLQLDLHPVGFNDERRKTD